MYNVKLEFYEIIDITQFVLVKNTPQILNLYGVITHISESGPNAHSVASCKSLLIINGKDIMMHLLILKKIFLMM